MHLCEAKEFVGIEDGVGGGLARVETAWADEAGPWVLILWSVVLRC
jgi:hypothetical protein